MPEQQYLQSMSDSNQELPSSRAAEADADEEPMILRTPSGASSVAPATTGAAPQAAAGPAPVRPAPIEATQDDLDRVREIIMGGPERVRQPVREAETERLRTILFGAQMEEYERRFADLRREIDRVLNDFRQARDAMEEFRQAQQERFDLVEREWHVAHEELEREVERMRGQGPILQNLVPQTRQLQILVNGLNQELGDLRGSLTRENQDVRTLRSTLEQYRDQQERSLDTLKREKRQAEDEIKEVRRVADRLDDRKTDRKVLAAILVELATRLETGYDAAGMLEGLVTPTEE